LICERADLDSAARKMRSESFTGLPLVMAEVRQRSRLRKLLSKSPRREMEEAGLTPSLSRRLGG